MEFTDLSTLGAQLLTISAVTKIFVDMLKLQVNKMKHASQIKTVASYVIPIVIALFFEISLFETDKEVPFYIGSVVAGGIAGLGSTFIHEILKALQTLKGLKK